MFYILGPIDTEELKKIEAAALEAKAINDNASLAANSATQPAAGATATVNVVSQPELTRQ